jgi:hypothetical protein
MKNLVNRTVHFNLSRASKLAAKVGVSIVGFAALVASQGARAAIDIAAATTGISDAQTAVLAVVAALLTMAIAVWGIRKVLKFFGGGR